MVITATILFLKHNAREHNRTAVSLWFSGRSSLYRIHIMEVLYHYYHLFSQNFTGRRDNAIGQTPLMTIQKTKRAPLSNHSLGTSKTLIDSLQKSTGPFY